MKYLFVLLFSVLCSYSIYAQQWKELKQAPLKLKYQIPSGWYVGGYTSGKACNCSGATINTADDRSLNMVIFSSNDVNLDSLKKQAIWGYNFAPPSSDTEMLETDYFNFEKALSTWQEDDKSAVLRFATSSTEFKYLVYFWGSFNDIAKHAKTIEHILKSIQQL